MPRLSPIVVLAVGSVLALAACQRSTPPAEQTANAAVPADAPPTPTPTPSATATATATVVKPVATPTTADSTPVDGTIRNAAERNTSDTKHIGAVPRAEGDMDRGANRRALPSTGKPVPPVERRAITPDDADRKLPAARVPGRGEAGGKQPEADNRPPVATPSNPPRLPRPRITETPRN